MNASWAPGKMPGTTIATFHWKATMASKSIKVLALAAIVTLAAYWYWSPFLAVRQLQAAAQSRDADAFNQRVDYPKVRASIKRNFSAMFEDNLAKAGADNALARAGAAFGARLGGVMVDRFVDTVVRPEMMMRAMQSGELSPMGSKQPGDADQRGNPPGSAPEGGPAKSKLKWNYERQGVDKLVLTATPTEEPDVSGRQKRSLGLVLERSGFANWKLTAVRLPGTNEQ
jgi:hypothetical protein